jgi:hypothetical protein
MHTWGFIGVISHARALLEGILCNTRYQPKCHRAKKIDVTRNIRLSPSMLQTYYQVDQNSFSV